jgi:uncharacterized protein (DUF2141 family)
MKHLILFILLISASYSPSGSQPSAGKIKITVNTFRNSNGNAGFALFNKGEDFPSFGDKAMKVVYVKISNNYSEVEFDNLPAGDYAIAVFHDENSNKELDTNFLGIPKEGVGCSNNPKGGFDPPKFEDARFKFSGSVQTISVNVRSKYCCCNKSNCCNF